MGTSKGCSWLGCVWEDIEVRLVSVGVGVYRSEGSWAGADHRLLGDCGVKVPDGNTAGAAQRSLEAGVGGCGVNTPDGIIVGAARGPWGLVLVLV